MSSPLLQQLLTDVTIAPAEVAAVGGGPRNPYTAHEPLVHQHYGLVDVPDVPERSVAVLAFDTGWHEQGMLCIRSIRRHGPASLAIVVLEMGLSRPQRRELAAMGVAVIPMPEDVTASADAPKYARAQTARPYLRDLVPGYDVYFWVDSDIRFLHDSAIPLYLRAATLPHRPIAIATELDPAYFPYRAPLFWHQFVQERLARLTTLYGRMAAETAAGFPQMNAGMWAMHRDCPVWDYYRAHVEASAALPFDRLAEQDGLNLAIMQSGMLAFVLPATHNWICSMATPLRIGNSGEFYHPGFPYVPLAVVHLTDQRSETLFDDEMITYGELYRRTGLMRAGLDQPPPRPA